MFRYITSLFHKPKMVMVAACADISNGGVITVYRRGDYFYGKSSSNNSYTAHGTTQMKKYIVSLCNLYGSVGHIRKHVGSDWELTINESQL